MYERLGWVNLGSTAARGTTEEYANLVGLELVIDEIGQADVGELRQNFELVQRRLGAGGYLVKALRWDVRAGSNVCLRLSVRQKTVDNRGHQLAVLMPDNHRRINST
ncbi:MAG: hypothetical protein ACXW5U_28795 [Thermoanaerobaculia bacterium]